MFLKGLHTHIKLLVGLGLIILTLVLLFEVSLLISRDSHSSSTLALTNPALNVHKVLLTENGFVPETLVIRQHDKVIFDTDTDLPHWPASSLHPTHEIYPEFDPKERIIPPENWEFVFDKPGEWKYHDHINEHATGIIIVLDPEAEKKVPTVGLENCLEYTSWEKQQCWDRQLRLKLEQEGLKAAFAFFVELYKTEPDVPKACHEWGHALGEASYEIYKDTGELVLVPEASYCGYGYFHSFIAELVKDTGQFEEVLQFCDDAEKVLGDELPSIADNCIHGVGHGTTAWLLEDPENWGNFQKTADEGTAICERIYKKPHDLDNCYDGVYNELHLDLFNDQYGLSFAKFMEKNDPFWICNEQEERHKRSCYFEFVGIFWSIFDLDFQKALDYIVANTHDLPNRGPIVIAKIAADWIQFDIVNESQEKNIQGCRTLPKYLFNACMQGIANGFVQHGEPNNLHPKAFAFCSASYLSDEERSLCFEIFLHMLEWHYTPNQLRAACTEIDEQYWTNRCAPV